MTVWDELKVVLYRLRDEQPGALGSFPTLEAEGDRQPPFKIRLAPWATATAEELHRQFGDDVVLRVGALPYPPDRQPFDPPDPSDPPDRQPSDPPVSPAHQPSGQRDHPPFDPPGRQPADPPGHQQLDPLDPPGRQPQRPRAAQPPADLLDPHEIGVELADPAVVSSGHTLRHGLLLTNRTGSELEIATNGHLTAHVVDPSTGEIVGGFAGAQTLPLIMFKLSPGETRNVPLLIGTASRTPRLGYAIPPGDWGIQATLRLGPSPRTLLERRTPILLLTVTA
jgi:hypothetical protein